MSTALTYLANPGRQTPGSLILRPIVFFFFSRFHISEIGICFAINHMSQLQFAVLFLCWRHIKWWSALQSMVATTFPFQNSASGQSSRDSFKKDRRGDSTVRSKRLFPGKLVWIMLGKMTPGRGPLGILPWIFLKMGKVFSHGKNPPARAKLYTLLLMFFWFIYNPKEHTIGL